MPNFIQVPFTCRVKFTGLFSLSQANGCGVQSFERPHAKHTPMSLLNERFDRWEFFSARLPLAFVGCFFGASLILVAQQKPNIDEATRQFYTNHNPGPNLQETAASAGKAITIRMGIPSSTRMGQGYGGASNEAIQIREKACAADLVVIAIPTRDLDAAFSEDGSTIFTVRRFQVEAVLRHSSVITAPLQTDVSVSKLGGSVIVNGHTISVVQPSVTEFQSGFKYLLFLRSIAGSTTTFDESPQSSYDLRAPHLASIVIGSGLRMSVDEARVEIEAADPLCPAGQASGALDF